jgi:hypothetical protein
MDRHEMAMRRILRRLFRRENGFAHGERVVFLEDGTPGTVHRSAGGYSHVYWDDEPDFGGSRVPNTKLRRVPR